MSVNVQKFGPEQYEELLHYLVDNARNGERQDFVPLILGWPGIGKSAIPKEVANNLGLHLEDTRLSSHESSDFNIPLKDDEDGEIDFEPPRRFKELGQDGEPVIWFIDELTHAKPPVQSVAFRMILDREVGNYQLPDNVVIVAAGNPPDKGGLYEMLLPLKDRFVFYELEPTVDGFIDYAERNNFDPTIPAYIEHNKLSVLRNFDLTNAEKPLTPRGWERVANILNAGLSDNLTWQSIYGSIGRPAGKQFHAFYNLKTEIPNLDDVQDNPQILVDLYDTKPDIYYNLRAVIQSELSPDDQLDLMEKIEEPEIMMQLLKPLTNKIIHADAGTEYEKLGDDGQFIDRLIEFAQKGTEEQRQKIMEFLSE